MPATSAPDGVSAATSGAVTASICPRRLSTPPSTGTSHHVSPRQELHRIGISLLPAPANRNGRSASECPARASQERAVPRAHLQQRDHLISRAGRVAGSLPVNALGRRFG